MEDIYTHTTTPIVQGASVVAVKYDQGILMCTDTLASYGSLARYKNIHRMSAVGSHTLIGASGEYSDFQEIVRFMREKETDDWIQHDSVTYNASQYAHYLASVMNQRRRKVNPLYNTVVIGGFKGAESYLASVDLYGTLIEGNFATSAFANHIAKPVLLQHWRPNLTEQEARSLIEVCMKNCWYRDSRCSDRVQFAKVTSEGVAFEEPVILHTDWSSDGFRLYPLNPIYA